MKYREISRKLKASGCEEIPRRGAGSHRVWHNPANDKIASLSCLVLAIILFCSACSIAGPASTPTPAYLTPTHTKTPQPTATVTPVMIQVNATVWTEEPLVPVITYHQFKPDGISPSDASGHKIQLGDLRASLQNLYDSGFSLVSLADWLAGNLAVPAGRRPLILSMDDLFFTNQLLLDDSGQPKPDTGIGVIWQFSQEHPDFGFHLALFADVGDKLYPFDPSKSSDPKNTDQERQREIAKTIVWCLENDALIYNHTYGHVYLSSIDVTMSKFIQQLQQEDDTIRYFLKLAGREDLIPRLGNIIALPGGAEPQTENDWATLQEYENPEGLPVQAVLNIYSAKSDPTTYEYFTGPYDPGFNKYNIPRMVANLNKVQYLADHPAEFPAAQSCTISLEESRAQDEAYLVEQMGDAIQSGDCPTGLFFVNDKLFDARTSPIVQLDLP